MKPFGWFLIPCLALAPQAQAQAQAQEKAASPLLLDPGVLEQAESEQTMAEPEAAPFPAPVVEAAPSSPPAETPLPAEAAVAPPGTAAHPPASEADQTDLPHQGLVDGPTDPDDQNAETLARRAALNYLPDPAVRQQDVARFREDMATAFPDQSERLASAFGGHDPLIRIGHQWDDRGLKLTNLADAHTALMVVGWSILNDRPVPTEPALFAAVRAQMNEALVERQALISANDAAKQRMAEGLYLRAAWFELLAGPAATDDALATRLKAEIARIDQQLKLGLNGLDLGPAGFADRAEAPHRNLKPDLKPNPMPKRQTRRPL